MTQATQWMKQPEKAEWSKGSYVCVRAWFLAPEQMCLLSKERWRKDSPPSCSSLWPYCKLLGAELLRIEVVSKWLVMDHKINQYLKKRMKFGILLYKKLVQAEFIGVGIVLGHAGRCRGRCHTTEEEKKEKGFSFRHILQKVWEKIVGVKPAFKSIFLQCRNNNL